MAVVVDARFAPFLLYVVPIIALVLKVYVMTLLLKIQGGAKEIVLIAQDSGIWGLDLSPRETLASLLERLATEFSNTWFRVLYLQPAGITDELMRVMATYDNICNYLDIPLQHCDPTILKIYESKWIIR